MNRNEPCPICGRPIRREVHTINPEGCATWLFVIVFTVVSWFLVSRLFPQFLLN